MRGALAISAVAALLATGCGGGGSGGATTEHGGVDTAIATTPANAPQNVMTETVTQAVPPPVTVTAPTPTPTSPEAAPGGAGDEEGIQSTVRLVVAARGGVSPASAQVPAFFNVRLVVENRDSAAHALAVGDVHADLRPQATTTVAVPGRAAGDVPILLDGRQSATLRVRAEATP